MRLAKARELLFLILSLSDFPGCQTTIKLGRWRKRSDPYISLADAMDTLQVRDALSCAVSCLRLSRINFLYSQQTSSCFLGGWLVTTTTPRGSAADVYARTNGFYCDVAANFTLFNTGSATSCLWLSDDQQNFTSALSVCQGKNAWLYRTNDLMKYSELVNISSTFLFNDTWIGLDDLDQDNVFRNTHDGSLLGPDLATQMFAPGQLNNSAYGQNCGSFSPEDGQLVSTLCNTPRFYLCEMFYAP